MSFDLLSLAKSSLFTLKYFATVSLIKSAEITFSLCCLNSFIVFSANSIDIGSLLREAIATILLNTPSSSLIFESILLAMFDNIWSSTIMFSSWAFFLNIARRVS